MLHVALWEPEIPANTGNIARLCAATGASLHLVGRLGFRLDERSLRRAGLDYWPEVEVHQHAEMAALEQKLNDARILCFSAWASTAYTSIRFCQGDCLLFGGESHGLPESVRKKYADSTFSIPMPTGKTRSLNLATAVGVVLYEALRQLNGW